jgi:hypothetical protein
MKVSTVMVGIALLLLMMGCAAEQPPEPPQQEQTTEQEVTEQPPLSEEQQVSGVETQDNISTDIQTETQTNESSQEEQPSQVVQPSPSARCRDSDVTAEHPDGINFDVVGNVTINGKPIERGTDYCANLATISEWYCMGDIARVRTERCPSGSCKDGVCV